jgi:predicted metal-dependent peptidase
LFYSELYQLYKSKVPIEILEFDTAITNKYKYRGKLNDCINGRGGTDYKDVVDYYNNKNVDK